MGRYFL